MQKSRSIAAAVRANAVRSAIVIAAFPFVIPALLALTTGAALLALGRPQALSAAVETFTLAALVMLAATLIWLPVGYLSFQWIIDRATRARLLSRTESPELWTTLEQLCRRADMPMPALRIIETDAMNAFASGLRDGRYSVTVTRGLLATLSRDELEGVLAHELSHIRNHDVRLMAVAAVLVGVIPMLHDLIAKLIWGLTAGVLGFYRAIATVMPLPGFKLMLDLSYGALWLLAKLALYVIGIVALLGSLTLQFALSRRREFMADAGAADLTRNPQALIRALRKISGTATLETGLVGVRAMLFENPIAAWGGLFATHPTIAARIAALEQLELAPAPAGGPATKSAAEPAVAGAEAFDLGDVLAAPVGANDPPAVAAERDSVGDGVAVPRLLSLDPRWVERFARQIRLAHPEQMSASARNAFYTRLTLRIDQSRMILPHLRAADVARAHAYLAQAIASIDRGDDVAPCA